MKLVDRPKITEDRIGDPIIHKVEHIGPIDLLMKMHRKYDRMKEPTRFFTFLSILVLLVFGSEPGVLPPVLSALSLEILLLLAASRCYYLYIYGRKK